jgi:hypothetical protein
MAHSEADHAEILRIASLAIPSLSQRSRMVSAFARSARLVGNGFTHAVSRVEIYTYGDRPWAKGFMPERSGWML